MKRTISRKRKVKQIDKSEFTKVSNMKIKKNTTGFINTSYSILTKNEFKAAIYEIGRSNNANVLEVNTNLTGKNFYFAKFEEKINKKIKYIVINPYTLYLAYASSICYGTIIFENDSWDLQNVTIEYILLNHDQLEESLNGSIDELAENEISQIRYWQPHTCGEVIFNYWD